MFVAFMLAAFCNDLFPHLIRACFGSLFWGVLIWKAKAEKALEESGLPYTVSAATPYF